MGDTPPNLNRPGDGPLLRARGLHKPVAMMIDGVDSVGEVRTVRRVGAGRRVQSEIVVARRYLEHGFVDAAMRIFGRHAAQVAADDWNLLVDRLLERGRVADAVGVCRTGDIPLPKEKLLDLGDRQLRRKDVDGAIHYYELGDADHDRWAALVDLLTRLSGRELQAMEVAERYLVPTDAAPVPLRLAVPA